MRTIFVIAMVDVKLILKDRMAVFWMLVFPLLFMFVFGSAFSRSSSGTPKTTLQVVLSDTGPVGSLLLDTIDQTNLNIEQIDPEASSDSSKRQLVIPENFSESIFNSPPGHIALSIPEDVNMGRTMAVKTVLYKAIISTIGAIVRANPGAENPLEDADFLSRLKDALAQERKININVTSAGTYREPPSGFKQAVPGNLVMFVMMVILINGGTNLAKEKKNGTFNRLLATSLKVHSIIAAKILGRVIPGLIQIGILLAAGYFLFHVPLGHSISGLLMVIITFSLCSATLGFLLGALVSSVEQATTFGVLFTLIMAALGGCWWPLEIVSGTMKFIGFLFPTAWAMQGFHKMISFGLDFSSVWKTCLVLTAYSVVFLIIGVRRLMSKTVL